MVFLMYRRQASGLDLIYDAVISFKFFPVLPLPSDRIIRRRRDLDIVLTRTVNKQQIITAFIPTCAHIHTLRTLIHINT
jgi:hypothetical protein